MSVLSVLLLALLLLSVRGEEGEGLVSGRDERVGEGGEEDHGSVGGSVGNLAHDELRTRKGWFGDVSYESANVRLGYGEDIYVSNDIFCSSLSKKPQLSCIPCNYSGTARSKTSRFSISFFALNLI